MGQNHQQLFHMRSAHQRCRPLVRPAINIQESQMFATPRERVAASSHLVKDVAVFHQLVEQQDHDVRLPSGHRPCRGSCMKNTQISFSWHLLSLCHLHVQCQAVRRTLTELGALAEEADDDGGVSAADGAVERAHPVVVHVLNGGAVIHQVLNLEPGREVSSSQQGTTLRLSGIAGKQLCSHPEQQNCCWTPVRNWNAS